MTLRRSACAGGLLLVLAWLLPEPVYAQRMSFEHTPPSSAPLGRDLEIVGNIVGGADDLARARCRYRQRGGAWKQVELAKEYGDLYRAIVPGADVQPPGIEYYCVGFDYFGDQSALYGSSSAPRRVRVAGARKAPEPEREAHEAAGPASRKVAEPAAERARADGPALLAREKPAPPVAEPPARPPPPRRKDPSDEDVALFESEEMVTLATRRAQSVADAPAIASGVFDDQMRSLGLRSVPDALKLVPGLETSRDVQGFWRVAVRGFRDESALLVMYDGHRLNSAYDGRALLTIPTENLERVEVMRGPGSALYGTGAFLGAVNIVSKRREGVEGAVSTGSFGTVDGHASAGQRFGSGFFVFADADFSRSDGYRATIPSDAASATMIKAGRRDDEPAGVTDDRSLLANVGAELRYAPPGEAQTRLTLRYLHENRGALVGLFDTVGRDSDLSWDVILADVTEEVPLSSGTLNAHLFFDHQVVSRLFQIAPAGYTLADGTVAETGLFERTRFAAQTFGLETSLDLSIAQSHKLSLGLSGSLSRLPSYYYELNFEETDLYSRLRAPSGYQPRQNLPELNSRMVGGAFAQHVWRVVPSLSLTLGLRLDVTQLPSVTLDQAGEAVEIDGTRLVPSLNPRLGLVWTPLPGGSLKLLYGRAFRAPSVQELSEQVPLNDFNQGRFEGNPGLRPAIIDTVEAGVEAATAVGEGKVRVRADGFLNSFTDPIMAVDTSGNIIPLQNRSLGVRVWGAEGEIRYETSSRAFTFLNVSWFRASDLAAPEGFQYLTDVPQYRLNWAAQIPLGRWVDFSVLAQAGAERRNNARSKLEALRHYKIPAYALFGAQLRTQPLLDHVEIALSAQNVFGFDLKDDVPRPDSSRMPGLLPREGLGGYLTVRGRL